MKSLSSEAYFCLKQMIIAGQFATGTKMREEHLAKSLSISRTPVRTALARLVEEGLLKTSGKSIEVASFQAWDVLEIFELRLLLEPHAAGLAALRCTSADIEQLNDLNILMEQHIESQDENRIAKIETVNKDFHHTVLNATGSARLIEMLSSYLDVPRITGSFYLSDHLDLRSSLEQHRQITHALRLKNQVLAQEAMKFHIMCSFMRYKERTQTNQVQQAAQDR